MNDLWRFDLNTKNWTFLYGNDTRDLLGVYTTPYGIPGCRRHHAMVIHPSNSLYVFGGEAYDDSDFKGIKILFH